MKKIIKIFLCCILLYGLTGCIETKNTLNDGNQGSSSTTDDLEFKKINFNEPIRNNQIELVIEKSDLSDAKLTAADSEYGYLEDIEGESYIYLLGSIKNISNEPINVVGLKAQAIIDDKYTYSAVFWDSKSYFDYLPVNKFKIYVSVPDEIANNFKKVEFKIGFYDDINYNVVSYRFDDYQNRYSILIENN